jgi:hypothetical protein
MNKRGIRNPLEFRNQGKERRLSLDLNPKNTNQSQINSDLCIFYQNIKRKKRNSMMSLL